jgi:hypothetical protein
MSALLKKQGNGKQPLLLEFIQALSDEFFLWETFELVLRDSIYGIMVVKKEHYVYCEDSGAYREAQ